MRAARASALAAEIARAARRRGATRALLLDLDGTLAPIAAHPRDARIPAPVLNSLGRLLRDGWRVAIVSGRPAADVRRMAPIPGVAVFGSHGIEGDGAAPVSGQLRAISNRAAWIARRARAWMSDFPGAWVERKPFGCAFHHRALHASVRPRFRRHLRVWLAGCDTRGLEVLHGKSVVELRPAGLGKGRVARRWPATRSARRGDGSLVAIGDDRTDEDLFAAVAGVGLTVRVGPRRGPTLARRRLTGTAAVARLLGTLAEAGGTGQRDERR